MKSFMWERVKINYEKSLIFHAHPVLIENSNDTDERCHSSKIAISDLGKIAVGRSEEDHLC